ncbi:MAG: hypothetical protein VYB90_08065 [Actinomycetota bacterium]|nr:hypothetical protein [Actinomycetota bacterium]
MAASDGGVPTMNWTRATVIGAFAGGTLWAVALYTLLASGRASAAWTAVGLAAVALLVAGALLSRTRSGSSWGVGLILAPLRGVVPVAVVVAAGVAADVGTSL